MTPAITIKDYKGSLEHVCQTIHPGGRCDICFEAILSPLCKLAKKYGTDKGGWHTSAGETCHNYTPTYYELFRHRREWVKHVLEIGVNYGPSLRMWEEYFPYAIITGLDSNASCLFTEGRIRCFAADQGNAESLEGAIAQAGFPKFDLIVDDGSHEAHHQILSARVLMPHLAKDGIYVIEDLEKDCQPELIGDQLSRYPWEAIDTGIGIGKARCGCGCGRGEQLLVLRHG